MPSGSSCRFLFLMKRCSFLLVPVIWLRLAERWARGCGGGAPAPPNASSASASSPAAAHRGAAVTPARPDPRPPCPPSPQRTHNTAGPNRNTAPQQTPHLCAWSTHDPHALTRCCLSLTTTVSIDDRLHHNRVHNR